MVGTAGWSIPPRHAACFPEQGSHLARKIHHALCRAELILAPIA
jgi:hypothetical protein